MAKSLSVQRDPYCWVYEVVKKDAADREIGGDLAGFKAKTEAQVRAKVEAEIRAKIEAEFAEKAAAAAAAAPPIAIAPVQVRSPPNVVLPKSLANAPSSAPRSAPAWTGQRRWRILRRGGRARLGWAFALLRAIAWPCCRRWRRIASSAL